MTCTLAQLLIITPARLKNYFKTVWQNLRSHKPYVVINTTGLAVGIAACLLIFLLIQYETSFDNFYKNKERIYRVAGATKTPDGLNYSQGSTFPVAEALRIDYPQLEHVARIYGRNNQQLLLSLNLSHLISQPVFRASIKMENGYWEVYILFYKPHVLIGMFYQDLYLQCKECNILVYFRKYCQ